MNIKISTRLEPNCSTYSWEEARTLKGVFRPVAGKLNEDVKIIFVDEQFGLFLRGSSYIKALDSTLIDNWKNYSLEKEDEKITITFSN